MKLLLPGASVCTVDGTFAFVWQGSGTLDMSVDRCTSLRIGPRGRQGDTQLVFLFRLDGHETSDMVVARLDVPTQYAAEAERFVAGVRTRYGIVPQLDNSGGEEAVSRVPRHDGYWITAPTHDDSEGLYREILDRIAAEAAS
ncbi:hypothetical protein ACFWXA_33105 [Streptomyces atroolivaceus]|uniref:hypothetical protein n=1 Tax=Streptomyces atroolivaceus TaxID=66869 RepID=UPI003647A014